MAEADVAEAALTAPPLDAVEPEPVLVELVGGEHAAAPTRAIAAAPAPSQRGMVVYLTRGTSCVVADVTDGST